MARYPLAYIAVSLVVRDALRPPWPPAHCGPGGLSAGRERVQITVIASTGRIWLEAESRADKQWVPDGAQALLDADYVSATWPSEQRFNLWIATCPDIAEDEPDPNCNLLTAARMQALFAVRNRAVLTQGPRGFPHDPFAPVEDPLEPPDTESAMGSAPALVPGPLARL